MFVLSLPPAPARPGLPREALPAGSATRARIADMLEVLLLTLLACLLGRTRPAARLLHSCAAPACAEHPAPQPVALLKDPLARAALGLPPHPLSPHADYVALGLVPGWVMRCFPALGMRPHRATRAAHRPSPAVRAPPATAPPRKPLRSTPLSHAHFVPIS